MWQTLHSRYSFLYLHILNVLLAEIKILNNSFIFIRKQNFFKDVMTLGSCPVVQSFPEGKSELIEKDLFKL